MKNRYSKNQIREAIRFFEKQLKTLNEEEVELGQTVWWKYRSLDDDPIDPQTYDNFYYCAPRIAGAMEYADETENDRIIFFTPRRPIRGFKIDKEGFMNEFGYPEAVAIFLTSGEVPPTLLSWLIDLPEKAETAEAFRKVFIKENSRGFYIDDQFVQEIEDINGWKDLMEWTLHLADEMKKENLHSPFAIIARDAERLGYNGIVDGMGTVFWGKKTMAQLRNGYDSMTMEEANYALEHYYDEIDSADIRDVLRAVRKTRRDLAMKNKR